MISVLLVDDDREASRLIQSLLAESRNIRFYLEQAESLSEALEITAQTRIDAILLALSPSFGQGLGTLIKLHAELPETPIIVLANLDDELLGIAATQEGAQDYLIKGHFDSSLLARSLRYVIERRRIEEQIDFDKTLFSQVRNAVIATDADGKITYWNPYAEKLYQWNAQEMIGQNIYQVVVAVDNLGSVEAIFARAEVVGSWEGEFTIQGHDGKTRPAYGTVTAITDHHSKLKGFVASAVDITERKQVETELNRHRDHLEQLVAERTEELTAANSVLQTEIGRREQVETELQFRVELEKLIATISTAFIDLPPSQVDFAVVLALRVLGEFAQVDRSYVVLASPDGKQVNRAFEWCVEGIEPQLRHLQAMPLDYLSAWLEKLKIVGTLQLTRNMPPLSGGNLETEFLRARNAQSLIAAPMFYGGAAVGFLGFETVREEKRWTEDIITLLGIAGQIFVNALEHQRTQDALYSSEERLRRLTDNMLDIIYQTDPQGIIEYASPSCMSVLGYPAESLVGQSIYSWLDPADVERVREAIQTVGTVEYRYQHADGHYLWLETLSNFLFVDDGTLKGFIFASRDITVRKQAERDLQELNRLKTEFLSTAAHELRTPLASIMGFSEILLTREIDVDRQKRYMRLINEQSIQLRKLVDALLDISRLESKENLKLDLQPVSIADLVAKALIPLGESSSKHRFQTDGLATCPVITGDPFRLSQVFQNLLSNAVKYSPDGGAITISGQVIPGFLQISVQDEGIGMTPEQQVHLFERFYRADASNTTISGTGLGLAISKLIVELHGGQIRLDSARGVGTTMHFTLPIANENTTQVNI